MAAKSPSSSSRAYFSPRVEINHIISLNEFEPIKIRINPRNHQFFRIVLWTKSAIDIEEVENPPVVPDSPPLGIHGFNPVNVSQGSNNHIVSRGHQCLRGKFDETRFRANVVTDQLRDRLNMFWPTLVRGSSLEYFLKRQAWKHNTNRRLFPSYSDFIAKGLHVGSYYIELLCIWMAGANFRFDNETRYRCNEYKRQLGDFLSFQPDLRFYKLPHRPGVLGVRKIAILGVVTILPNQARQFNPINFELYPGNLRFDERIHFGSTSVFVLETLRSSCHARAHLLDPPVQTHKRKPDVEGEGGPNKKRRARH